MNLCQRLGTGGRAGTRAAGEAGGRGFPAELLAVRGARIEELSLAYGRVVIHCGRVVSRAGAVREYAEFAAFAGPDLPRQSGSPA